MEQTSIESTEGAMVVSSGAGLGSADMMPMMNRRFPFRSALAALTLAAAGMAAPSSRGAHPQWDTWSDTWAATDGLGRSLPTAAEAGAPRTNRTVGIFYFLWLETKGPILDISRMLQVNSTNPPYGPHQAFHWWGEPLLGYYRADDEFVIRKHAQMLTDAGVDVIIFDVTNGFTYDPTWQAICRVYERMRAEGMRTPRIAFIAHSGHERVLERLSQNLYSKGLHKDLWFSWKGKPLLLTPFKGLNSAVSNFFSLRASWAWTQGQTWFGDGRDRWPWLDHTPQTPGWHESPDRPEAISVAVAEHPVSNIGRSFHSGRQPTPDQTASRHGLYFDEQWKRAIDVEPEFVFVTGWNEWIAQRFISDKGGQPFLGKPLPPGSTFFVDQYSQEFSRDIEPMKGGHGDDYYYQLAGFIRRYKGVRTTPPVTSRPIRIDGRFDDWAEVQPEFRDDIGDPARRRHPGCGNAGVYTNDSGRNDLVVCKVSSDGERICFYARAQAPLTPSTDPNWMLLFIDADRNPTNGWLGYDFLLNRKPLTAGAERLVLERHQGSGYQWTEAASVSFRAEGRELELAIPRKALGLGTEAAVLDFKWVDNPRQSGHWSDFTLDGDAAPNDRFIYRARLE